jgi:murein DD-endopeptidase MepM/ murein hydrolase activator NlpD
LPRLPSGPMSKQLNLELPKYRLQLHLRLVKRRKPLIEEPLIPTLGTVKKKYRKGSLFSRYFRHIFEHKSIRKILAANFALIAVSTAFVSQTSGLQAQGTIDPIVESQTTLVTEKGMQYPVDSVEINQGYSFFHPAIDLGGKTGDSIKAIMPGVVSYAGWGLGGYGNLIVLSHKNDIESYYAHLSQIEVKTGDIVEMGVEIGKMGATGHATGPHLHLEIHQNGVPLNPLFVLSK